jgi:hypothetical protein
MAEMLYQQKLEKQGSSDQKRKNFGMKGRGKSAILPDRTFMSEERDFSMKKVANEDTSKSPRLFNRNSGGYDEHINVFSELHRGIKWSKASPGVSFDHRKYRSMKNFAEYDTTNILGGVDFKQQELNRRSKRLNSDVLRSEEGEDEAAALDKEYYEFLQSLMDKEMKTPSRKQSENDKQSFLHHKTEKEWVKDWYKMVKNLRFKIHYNHFHENLRHNEGATLWKHIKEDLLKHFSGEFDEETTNSQDQVK